MSNRSIIAVLVLAATLCVAGPAYAVTASQTPSRTYDLDFTLPTAGKSGCTVCHADPNLVRADETSTISLFVDSVVLAESAHKDTPCTGCHIDFAYKVPHENIVENGEGWREVAKSACKNCHTNQFTVFASGVHSPASRPGEDATAIEAARRAQGKPTVKPMCGDCHGGHSIPSKTDTAAVEAYRMTALEVCGTCHTAESDSYADYYHGAAYKEGAKDAPTCWDCHGTHEIFAADDRKSMVNSTKLTGTCSAEGTCHSGEVTDQFVLYAPLIHRKAEIQATIPFWTFIDSTRSAIQGVFETIGSWF